MPKCRRVGIGGGGRLETSKEINMQRGRNKRGGVDRFALKSVIVLL